MELLNKIYFDSSTGYLGKNKLYRRAKEQDKSITLKLVQEFLDQQAVSQIIKETEKIQYHYITWS